MKEKRGRRQHLLTKDSYLSIYGHIVQVVVINNVFQKGKQNHKLLYLDLHG